MARHAREQALQMTIDSEEDEFCSESEELDDEDHNFEESFDPAQDTFSEE